MSKRLLCIAVVLLALAALCLGNPVQNASPLPSVQGAAALIRAELESHGERVLGNDAYHWSTRLEKIEACRAEFSVRVANNVGEPTVTVESVNFSLGALNPYGIELQQKRWLQLPCSERGGCIFSTATCSRTSKEGIVTDCSTASQKRADAFSLQFDGDAAAAERLQQALRQAIGACRAPQRVSF